MKNLTKEETFEAIKQGVTEAFLVMMESGDGCSSARPIRTAEVMEAIENGVRRSFDFEMPDKEDLKNIYFDAVYKANLQ
jgi:hypothetical protein